MARLRLQFSLNPGRTGAPMDKLGEFTSQAEKFLRAFVSDLGLTPHKGEWLAVNFENHSVQFDAEYAGALTDAMLARSRRGMLTLTGDDPLSACTSGLIGYGTIAQFSKLADALDPDEAFKVGIFDSEDAVVPEIRSISRRKLAEIRQLLNFPLVSYGSIQGVIDAWHLGGKPPFFVLRQLSDGVRIHCNYLDDVRPRIVAAVNRPNTVLHVYGDIHWERATNSIIEISVKDIESAHPLSDDEFDNVFGSIPLISGEMSTADYVDWLRGDGE